MPQTNAATDHDVVYYNTVRYLCLWILTCIHRYTRNGVIDSTALHSTADLVIYDKTAAANITPK
jgi:hypothetical protein